MTDSTVVQPPSLAGFLRAARRRRGISREALAAAATVSSSYVTQLESGEKTHPSAAALTALAAALGFDANERRHAFNLARLPRSEPNRPAGAQVIADIRDAIDDLPCMARLADDRWNVLAVNTAHQQAFPEVLEYGNLVRWLFAAPIAKEVLVEWEAEAATYVHLMRGLSATGPDNQWLAELLDELSRHRYFVKFWNDGRVAFHRARPYMHARDPRTGELYTINAQLYVPLLAGGATQMYLGVKVPYRGPRPAPRIPRETSGPKIPLRPPSLGEFLRDTRKSRDMSRDQLAAEAAVSASYIAQLETGDKDRPSAQSLRALTQALRLGPVELRHAFNLARVPQAERPGQRGPVSAACPRLSPAMRAAVDTLPCIAVCSDKRWLMLHANAATEAAFPGVTASGNLLRWMFTDPQAKRLMIEWDYEVATAVHWLRGAIGGAAHNGNLELLRQLADVPEFAAIWADERVVFRRDQRYMHLRDPMTDEPYSIFNELYSTLPDSPAELYVYLGVREPYRGPVL